jgi:mRNA-degrading endonuclease RelE of RelBE toxin-antitoxin system
MSPGRRHVRGPLYDIEIPPEMAETLRGLPPAVKRQSKQALIHLAETPEAGKPLTGDQTALHSYRARRFRIVYEVVALERRLLILYIGHRKAVYEELAQRVRHRQPPQ